VHAGRSVDTSELALGRDFSVNSRTTGQEAMEYSVTVWRTPVRESKEVLHYLTFRRDWIQELNCWRDTLVSQQIDSATFSSGKGLASWPTRAADSSPKYESEPGCDDAAAFAADLAPRTSVPRSGENGS